MKLDIIFKEDYQQGVRFGDLSPQQVSCLIRMSNGVLSYETASPREMAVIDSLKDLGLVDEFDELNNKGELAARLGKRNGSVERREAEIRDKKLDRVSSKPSRYTDIDDGSDISTETNNFTDRWSDVKDYD